MCGIARLTLLYFGIKAVKYEEYLCNFTVHESQQWNTYNAPFATC